MLYAVAFLVNLNMGISALKSVRRVMFAQADGSVDTLLDVVGDIKKMPLAQREPLWGCLSRLCAASGWTEGLRALSLERSIRYRGDPLGASLAHWASWGGDLEACLIALEMEGAGQASSADHTGMTPMHWAAVAEAGPPLCHALLKSGGDPAARDRFESLAAHWSDSEGFWAWTMSALWARGRRLSQLASPLGLGHEQAALALGHAQAARWIRWELGSACAQPVLADDWVRSLRQSADRIENQVDIDLGVANRLGLGFDWRA